MTDLIWSFAPWLVFLLANRMTSFYGAVAAALAAAAVVIIRAVARGRLHLLDGASLAYFVALGPCSLRSIRATRHMVPLCPGRLAYRLDRHRVRLDPRRPPLHRVLRPRKDTQSRLGHRRLPRRQSSHLSVWGLAFLVGTVSLIVAGSVDYRQALLRVIVPFGTLIYAYKYTQSQQKESTGISPQGCCERPWGRSWG